MVDALDRGLQGQKLVAGSRHRRAHCVDTCPCRIPFYYAFKLAFLVFLGHPQWKGAVVVYNSFLKVSQSVFPPACPLRLDI
jgi:hypothetical protein